MRQGKLLIFDLDDTLFETRSIGKKHLKSIFAQFRNWASGRYSVEILDEIENDLWRLPYDQVSFKYRFSDHLKQQLFKLISQTEFHFDIQPFSGFQSIRNLNFQKVLVTTGFRNLQEAKIDALGIGPDFQSIHIDEIDASPRLFKSHIFTELVNKSGLPLKNHVVIGDNPDSELKIGRHMGLTTIQVAKFGQPLSIHADHYITNLEKILPILGSDENQFS